MDEIISFTNEPDPAITVNYCYDFYNGLLIDSSDFVYLKDPVTGKSLAVWPKNYEDIPVKSNDMKIYNDNFIWLVTPADGEIVYST